MVATASSAAADISSNLESVHPQFSATTALTHTGVGVGGVALKLGSDGGCTTSNRSESPTSEEQEENLAPMDLSSGGGGGGGMGVASGHMATPSFIMAAAVAAASRSQQATPTSTTSLADSLLNARRLAEFVRAQQQAKNETTPPNLFNMPPTQAAATTVPRKRAWPELQLDLSAMVKERLRKGVDDFEGAGQRSDSPTDSNSSSAGGGGAQATPTSNKDVKKRRLDELLSKKFSVNDSPPPTTFVTPTTGLATPTNGIATPPIDYRRNSSEKKQNRRFKRSSPSQQQQQQNSCAPVTLSLRPNSQLLAGNSNNPGGGPAHQQAPPIIAAEDEPVEPELDEEIDSKSALKKQILQLHLAQAALLNQSPNGGVAAGPGGVAAAGGFPGLFPGFPGNNNPLLYYGYYAQMIQGLQSQQQKLLDQLTGKQTSESDREDKERLRDLFYNVPRSGKQTSSPLISSQHHQNKAKIREMPNPFHIGQLSSPNNLKSNFSPRGLTSPPSPKYRDADSASPHGLMTSPHGLMTSPMSGIGTGLGDEPRRRAPRALTGRHVKSGPGASPRTLAILRKKIEERLKLKELLGENSHLYFGALNKINKSSGAAKKTALPAACAIANDRF